ncbi:flagellar biosynthetic protein FliO [Tautonia plasticadhaerens]|nr:flagellar biosynthetic protein FliO [Tautonia plasticadhaerens]
MLMTSRTSPGLGPGSAPRRLAALPAVLAAALVLAGSPSRAQDAPQATGTGGDPAPAFGGGGGIGFDGSIGVAATAVLAVLGVAVLASGRLRPAGGAGALRVVGRAHLTGRHAVYLLRAGDRTLILGVGSQGPPALLGELETSAEPAPGLPADPIRPGGKG